MKIKGSVQNRSYSVNLHEITQLACIVLRKEEEFDHDQKFVYIDSAAAVRIRYMQHELNIFASGGISLQCRV
jgi:hypothetical protein